MNGLVGIPYRRGGTGGTAVDCWNLVRQACQQRHGVLPPLLAERMGPLVRGARAQGWVPVRGRPADGDVLVMRTAAGERHVGMVLALRRRLELLHAVAGGSICQPLADLPALGFHGMRAWRLRA